MVIPTFAVERAQELMYYISRLVHAKKIPRVKVFVDSPMAVDVTEVYRGLGDFFDDETLAMIAKKLASVAICVSVWPVRNVLTTRPVSGSTARPNTASTMPSARMIKAKPSS